MLHDHDLWIRFTRTVFILLIQIISPSIIVPIIVIMMLYYVLHPKKNSMIKVIRSSEEERTNMMKLLTTTKLIWFSINELYAIIDIKKVFKYDRTRVNIEIHWRKSILLTLIFFPKNSYFHRNSKTICDIETFPSVIESLQ